MILLFLAAVVMLERIFIMKRSSKRLISPGPESKPFTPAHWHCTIRSQQQPVAAPSGLENPPIASVQARVGRLWAGYATSSGAFLGGQGGFRGAGGGEAALFRV